MLTALIAEDELLVRMGISSSVPWSEMDIAVVGEARDGLEAWELYQKYHPDIVILDLLMPGMSGVELLGRIRENDPRCAVIVVTSVDKGEILDKVRALGISGILHKMTMKRDDISEAVRKVLDSLRPAQDESSVTAMQEKKAWEDFLFGDGLDGKAFQAEGITGIRLFPNERLTPALQRSLSMLLLRRLGTSEAYVTVDRDNCQLLIWKDLSAGRISENALVNFARYVQDNFHIDMGIATVFASLAKERLPHLASRIVTLLHDPQMFDYPVLLLDVNGNYCNERLDEIRSALMISLPVCSSRDEIQTLKIRLDRFPGELGAGFRGLLKRAAPLLESLNLSASQPGLWEMTRSICDNAEERLNRASPRIRPEIRKAMAYIQSHLAENIQRDTLGRLVNYDSVYFSKLFKTELGMSYTDYLLYVRMLRAQTLLCETDLSIGDIAEQCGYTNFSYFSERFGRFCGMTPYEWRENNREAMD